MTPKTLIHSFLFLALITTSCMTSSMLTTNELQVANRYFNQQEYEKSIEHYQAYIGKSKMQGKYRNFEAEADVNRKIAHVYSVLGKYSKNILYLNDAMRLDSLDNNRFAFTEDIRLLGMPHAYSNDYKQAIFYLQKAIDLTENFNKSIKESKLQTSANTYLSLAQIHATLGDFTLSNQYVSIALNLYQKIKDEYGLAQALNHLAWLQVEAGNYLEAGKNVNKSIDYYGKLKLFAFEQYNVLSNIAMKLCRFEDALRYSLESLVQADSSRILPQMIWSTIQVGDVYKKLGQNELAKGYYFEAMKLNRKMDQSNLTPAIDYRTGNLNDASQSYLKNKIKYGAGITALKLGDLYRESNPDSAICYYNQSVELFKTLDNKEYLNNALVQQSDFLIDQGNSEQALKNLTSLSKTSNGMELSWQKFFILGKANESLRQDSIAILNYKNAIDIIEELRATIAIEEFRDSYFSDKIDVYDHLIHLLLKEGKNEEAWFYSEKSRARTFLDLIAGQKIGESHSADSTMIKREKELKAEIAFLLKSIKFEAIRNDSTRGIYPVINQKLKEKQEEYDKIVSQLNTFKSKYLQLIAARIPNLKEVREKLKKNNVIVEYWCGKQELKIDVITKDSTITKIVNINETYLKDKVTLFINSIDQPEENVKVYLNNLHDVLWKPIEQYISPDQKVCIVPHQCLHYVPFAALYQGQYLIEKQFIHYSVSAALYRNDTIESLEDQFLGIALKQSNVGNFQPLIGTDEEVKSIQHYFNNSTLVMDEKTSESLVKKSMPNATIIHFATHGFFDEEHPLDSYLLLNSDAQNDGRLTVNEIFNSSIDSKLTTLSACETAKGSLSKGDDVISLNRAFLYAGSANVISSLWKINDKTTPKLMNDMYNYYKQKYSFEEALCMAQRDFIKNTSSNPKLWSAFILYN